MGMGMMKRRFLYDLWSLYSALGIERIGMGSFVLQIILFLQAMLVLGV